MSEANVELVRRIHSAWSAHISWRGYLDPAIEYVNPPDAVEPGTRRGIDSFARVGDAYEDVRIELDRLIDVGNDDVVVIATVHATGRSSGVPIEWHHGYIWTIRDGKAVRFRWFNDPEQALEAAGLSAPPGDRG
jgi:ketosteroid isomerase-like protein